MQTAWPRTACIITASCRVGPILALPRRYRGASMCTNGSGTNSVMPPVRCCNALQHAPTLSSEDLEQWSANARHMRMCAPDGQKMLCPVSRRVNVPKHDGARCPQAHCVCGLHHLDPLGSVKFVRADDAARTICEDLCCCAWQRTQPSIPQKL
jgi:hypothetical protein